VKSIKELGHQVADQHKKDTPRHIFQRLLPTKQHQELVFRDVDNNPKKYDAETEELIRRIRKGQSKFTDKEQHVLNHMVHTFIAKDLPAPTKTSTKTTKNKSKKEKRPEPIEVQGETFQPFWWLLR
jgi:hypothetical protein